jgi:predicted nucleic acid-binding protein
MIVDTSALLAYFHPKEPSHPQVAALFGEVAEPLIVSPLVLAELDYLVLSRLGARAEAQVLRAVLGPAWEIAQVTRSQLTRAADIVELYADQPIGLTDAVNVALAESFSTRRIATLDHRHFGVLRFADGTPVEILP